MKCVAIENPWELQKHIESITWSNWEPYGNKMRTPQFTIQNPAFLIKGFQLVTKCAVVDTMVRNHKQNKTTFLNR
jgi:hypothetical protein